MPSDFREIYRGMDDIAMRHRDSFVGYFHEGKVMPYLVRNISGNMSEPSLDCYELRDGMGYSESRMANILMDDANLIIGRPELGMANIKCQVTGKAYAVWCSGSSQRQLRRSLAKSQFSLFVVNGTELKSVLRSAINKSGSHNDYSMLNAFYNEEYPMFDEALQAIRTGQNASVAFSKRFALSSTLSNGICLFYKDIKVGHVDLDNDTPILLENYNYLQEQLEETAYVYGRNVTD